MQMEDGSGQGGVNLEEVSITEHIKQLVPKHFLTLGGATRTSL